MMDRNVLEALLAALGALPVFESRKDTDYEHPLSLEKPIHPCCEQMGKVLLLKAPCNCPDKAHQGGILHSLECSCPDRFIPLADISEPPKVVFSNGTAAQPYTMQALEINVSEVATTEIAPRLRNLDNLN